VLRVAVAAQVDVELLADELKEDVGRHPHRIQQSITEMSWGHQLPELSSSLKFRPC